MLPILQKQNYFISFSFSRSRLVIKRKVNENYSKIIDEFRDKISSAVSVLLFLKENSILSKNKNN